MHFHDRKNREINKIVLAQSSYTDQHELKEGEEVIGIYGAIDRDAISSLGFSVWRPPTD